MLLAFYIILGLLLILLIGLFIFVNYIAPPLPEGAEQLIKQIKSEALPELIEGETGIAKNGSISIGYESIGDQKTAKASIVFICGHTQIMLDWPKHIYQPFLDAGYHVIRFDNRGVGASDWMKDWTKKNAYTLEDMATDVIAILDHLQIAKAHIIGMSMGGMISQRLAISHTDRVLSLTSIMSTGYFNDPKLVNVPPDFYRKLVALMLKYPVSSKKLDNQLKLNLSIRNLLLGDGPYDLNSKYILQKAYYELKKRRGYNAKATDQHTQAINKSGSRYEELKNIQVPTLVIHGKADPLIKLEHAKKYAPMIPHADTLFIEGMGHDLPNLYSKQITDQILKNLEK
jgi:pimeloyl-ACP methyl ester carboxylesterase